MSKLSDAVKALINAGHAAPGYTRASAQVQPALSRFAADAGAKKVGLPAWVTVSTAVSATLNCPEAMTSIFELANQQHSSSSSTTPARTPAQNAELIREVGLKCISFNGIPRSINTLGAFHAALPPAVVEELARTPATRAYAAANLAERQRTGRALWDSVYAGVGDKLLAKLARSHPDLPVHILDGHYASLLANPAGQAAARGGDGVVVGRVLTSLVAVACLRAQTGVGPQVTSHVFGLRKAYASGEAAAEPPVDGGPWLASDDGTLWLLNHIDGLVRAIAGDAGTTFAPGLRAKL